jgi:hypothetical protein
MTKVFDYISLINRKNLIKILYRDYDYVIVNVSLPLGLTSCEKTFVMFFNYNNKLLMVKQAKLYI